MPEGAIYGILGPNGAGKTTTLRMLLGIIDPDEGERRVLGHDHPHDIARPIGYLPEERGLYPSMKAYEAIAFLGALRGLPLAEGRKRGRELLEAQRARPCADRQIRQLSKGMAQQVQLLGTLVHEPRLVVLDEPFSGLDAINQGKLERLIRDLAGEGHDGDLLDPRHRPCRAAVRRRGDHRRRQGALRRLGRRRARPHPAASPARDAQSPTGRGAPRCRRDARREGEFWHFPLPESGVEPLLRALIEGDAGILSLSIERAGLHDAFVAIAGEAAAKALEAEEPAETAHERRTTPVRCSQAAWVVARRDFMRDPVQPRVHLLPARPAVSARRRRARRRHRPARRERSRAPQIGIAMAGGRRRRDARGARPRSPASSAGRARDRRAASGSARARRSTPRGVLERREGNFAAVLTGTPAAPRADRHRASGSSGGAAPVGADRRDARERGARGLSRGRARATVAASGASDTRGRMRTAQAGQMLLFLLTMLLAGMVLSNLVEEKANKIIEILAAAIPMDAVFLGKLFAMLAVSLVGIAVWAR